MSKKDSSMEKDYLATECDKIGEIAVQYGFTVIKPPYIVSADTTEAKKFKEFDHYEDAEEKIALTKWYMEYAQTGSLPGGGVPAMIHYKKPLSGSALRKKPTEEMYGLEIMGTVKAESEALILKTTLAILTDLGYKDLCIDVNSIGDRESIAKFERELSNYYRKHGSVLLKKHREEFKKNHYSILKNASPETEEFLRTVPATLDALSDMGRAHFKEVLEYMEMFGVMYKMKMNMFSNKLYSSHTIFEIRDLKDVKSSETGTLLAYGYRYNYLAKKIGAKKEIPSIGMTLVVKKSLVPAKKVIIKNIKKPRFYLVQLGGTAKLKALNVVEMLRQEKIPVYHSLTKDKITGQLSGAEYMRATHVLIIGQKEAVENSIVVRHVVTREQETVYLCDLVSFLRAIE